MFRIIAMLVVSECFVFAQESKTKAPPTDRPVSVCEILSDPARFDGKIVQVRSRSRASEHGSYLEGDGCPGIFVTEGYVWPSEISLAPVPVAGQPRSGTYLHPVNFNFDLESMTRWQARVRVLLQTTPFECLEFTYTGLFETRLDWSKAKQFYKDGTWKFGGFGQVDAMVPGQLIAKSQDDVRVIPNCPTTAK